jgi:hypothetical protein
MTPLFLRVVERELRFGGSENFKISTCIFPLRGERVVKDIFL